MGLPHEFIMWQQTMAGKSHSRRHAIKIKKNQQKKNDSEEEKSDEDRKQQQKIQGQRRNMSLLIADSIIMTRRVCVRWTLFSRLNRQKETEVVLWFLLAFRFYSSHLLQHISLNSYFQIERHQLFHSPIPLSYDLHEFSNQYELVVGYDAAAAFASQFSCRCSDALKICDQPNTHTLAHNEFNQSEQIMSNII